MLFTGSGFSFGAKNRSEKALPRTSELAALLLKAAERADDVPFDIAADLFRRKFSHNPTALPEFLKALFNVGEVTAAQSRISAEPWVRIYTTNYDNIVEFASDAAGLKREPVSISRAPSSVRADMPWIVHLHGYPEELSGQNVASPLLLGRISYVDSEVMRTKWPSQFQTDLFRSAAVIVAGFSFSDLHIARLFRETTSIKRKTFIVVESGADDALIEAAGEFGTVVTIGTDGLADALDQVDTSIIPDDLAAPILSFSRLNLPDAVKPQPADVWNLLVAGTFRPECHLSALIDPTAPYSFNRNYGIRTVADWSGNARKVVLTSRIGNGKSIFLQQLAVQLGRDGFLVLEGGRASDRLHEELQQLKAEDRPIAFLYEGAREYEDAIGVVLDYLSVRDILIVTTRSSGTASEQVRLRELLGSGTKRVDLDRLEAADLRELDAVLSFYGLWPEGAGETESDRRKFVEEECDNEVRGVLLHVFNSPSISSRIREPVERLSSDRSSYTVLICLLASRLANIGLSFSDICDMFNLDRRAIHRAFADSGVRDLVPDTDDNFRARSPVLAEHLLAHIIEPVAVHDALKLFLEMVIDFRAADTRYAEALPSLLRFAFVTRAFRGARARELILSYYESALMFAVVRDDPQFWLQLAMARIEFLEWEPAGKALDSAYQKAKRLPAYLTFMIDNQKARYLLMSATSGFPSDLDENAKGACEIMQSRLTIRGGEVDVYSFRLIYPLLAFFDKFSSTLQATTVALIRSTLRQAESVLQQARQHRMLSSEEERAFRTLRGRRPAAR